MGIELDFEDMIGSAVARPVLIPVIGGDTIIIPEVGTFEVEGEVKNPGSFKITGKKSVMGAIAAAGGFGYAAQVREVEVIRDIGGGKKAFIALNLEDIALKGQDDVRVRDGDLIRVPTQSGRHIERQIVEGINAVFRGVGVQGRMN
jgi:protein involved in polysaccharide export with SLBB domain